MSLRLESDDWRKQHVRAKGCLRLLERFGCHNVGHQAHGRCVVTGLCGFICSMRLNRLIVAAGSNLHGISRDAVARSGCTLTESWASSGAASRQAPVAASGAAAPALPDFALSLKTNTAATDDLPFIWPTTISASLRSAARSVKLYRLRAAQKPRRVSGVQWNTLGALPENFGAE
ncbi:hypothetical protein NKI88_16020 [Mesorhizobium sp. M0317]|uniref:hypothetical protein n=1 Tax=Mesorhizobium sp. M0317 TaxID=2956935 RepID=UPI0033394F33